MVKSINGLVEETVAATMANDVVVKADRVPKANLVALGLAEAEMNVAQEEVDDRLSYRSGLCQKSFLDRL